MAGQGLHDDEWRAFQVPDADIPADSAGGIAQARASLPIAVAAPGRPLVGWRVPGETASFTAALAQERDRGTGFVLLPVWMATGVLAYGTWPHEPSLAWLLAGVGCLLGALFLAKDRFLVRGLLVAVLACLCGAALAAVETRRASTPMMGSEIGTNVTGRVARIEHQATGRVRLTIDVSSTARPELRYAPDRVRLSAREVPPGLEVGAFVSGIARLMPPSGPVRPGGYDFAFNSYFDGIGAIGFFLRNPEIVATDIAPTATQALALRIERLRDAIAARIRAHLEGSPGEIAAALIAGVRAGIPETVNEDLRKTGLAHILSISGLHMVLVAGTVLFAIRGAFAFFPVFASRHPVKKYAAIVALVASAFYLGISGGAVAAQRSFIMLAVMLVAILFDRAALTMRNLAISAIIVIAISPHEVFGPSFQMSFAATAALIGAYAWWSERQTTRTSDVQSAGLMGRLGSGAAKFMLGLAMTSIVAGLATTLYGAYHFHRVSPHSLWVNLLAMPVVSTLVMPFAVLSAVAMPLGLEGPFLKTMGFGIETVTAIAAWFSARSPIDAVGVLPLGAVLVFTGGLVILTAFAGRLRLLALPLLLLGTGLIVAREQPDVLVSEDGRLVAIMNGSGGLSVNRDRPNGFTIENWLYGMNARQFEKPAKAETVAAAISLALPGAGFVCAEATCVARDGQGRLIAHLPDATSTSAYCATASLIVIDDATAETPCRTGAATVLTKRDMARSGSAEVYLSQDGAANRIVHAIDEPYRPWHDHRQYSREARGMPPYQRD